MYQVYSYAQLTHNEPHVFTWQPLVDCNNTHSKHHVRVITCFHDKKRRRDRTVKVLAVAAAVLLDVTLRPRRGKEMNTRKHSTCTVGCQGVFIGGGGK